MANTPVEILYVALKTEYEPTISVRYPYVYDDEAVPYIYIYEVDDTRDRGFLSDTEGGRSRMTIGYLSRTFENCVDQLETIITYVRTLIGTYSPSSTWQIQITSVRDLTGIEEGSNDVFRREFDVIVSWSR